MQHGSIPLAWDLDKMRAVFGRPPNGGQSAETEMAYRTGMTSLQEAGNRAYGYVEVVAALARGIAETWEVELAYGQLSTAERQLSAHLRDTKYCSDTWTWHR
jgi:lipoate-protein ligase A